MATNEFVKLVSDFTADLFRTFPEYEQYAQQNKLHQGYIDCIAYQVEQDVSAQLSESIEDLFNQMTETFPERFFDILYKNETPIFGRDASMLLPTIHLPYLWSQEVSDNTRDILWNYLHLFLFSVLRNCTDSSTFGDAAKMFEAIDQDTLHEKLRETVEGMQNMFDSSNADTSGNGTNGTNFTTEDLPNASEIHGQLEEMMDGKIGKLAKEIAEETAEELNINFDEITDMNQIFKKLFQNPTKVLSMMKNMGSKLDSKMKSGEFKESELMEEAKEMMQKMKGMTGDMKGMEEMMPGMEQFMKTMGKNGMPDFSKMSGNSSYKAMESQLQQNIQRAKQRERMVNKFNQRNKNQQTSTTQKFTVGEGASPYRTTRDFNESAKSQLAPLSNQKKNTNPKKKKKKRKK